MRGEFFSDFPDARSRSGDLGGQCFRGFARASGVRWEGLGWSKRGSECCKRHESSVSTASSSRVAGVSPLQIAVNIWPKLLQLISKGVEAHLRSPV
jgi:hypothetical protein